MQQNFLKSLNSQKFASYFRKMTPGIVYSLFTCFDIYIAIPRTINRCQFLFYFSFEFVSKKPKISDIWNRKQSQSHKIIKTNYIFGKKIKQKIKQQLDGANKREENFGITICFA